MKTCKTCRFWHRRLAQSVDVVMICVHPKLTEPGFCDHRSTDTDLLIYSYDEGGYFETGPDFGCVHHREVANDPV
jgi:hypothetical protein